MSKVECTAVNELVDLVRNRALEDDDADADLFASSSPRAHHLRGTPAPSLFEMPAPPPAPPAPGPSPIAMVSLPCHARHAQRRALPPDGCVSAIGQRIGHFARRRYVPLSTLGRRAAMPVAGLVGLGIIAGIAYTRLSHHDAAAPARSLSGHHGRCNCGSAGATPVVAASCPAAPAEPTVPSSSTCVSTRRRRARPRR